MVQAGNPPDRQSASEIAMMQAWPGNAASHAFGGNQWTQATRGSRLIESVAASLFALDGVNRQLGRLFLQVSSLGGHGRPA